MLMPPGIREIQLDKKMEFRIPVEGGEEIIITVPEGISSEGRQRAIDIFSKMRDGFGFSAIRGTSVILKRPQDEYYYIWIRGVQIEFHATSADDAVRQARHWWWLTDVSL
jgi:hypothetical protein